jgi:hypothetical protein
MLHLENFFFLPCSSLRWHLRGAYATPVAVERKPHEWGLAVLEFTKICHGEAGLIPRDPVLATTKSWLSLPGILFSLYFAYLILTHLTIQNNLHYVSVCVTL